MFLRSCVAHMLTCVTMEVHLSNYLFDLWSMLPFPTAQFNVPLNKLENSAISDHSHTKNHPFQIFIFSVTGVVNNQSDLHILISLYISSSKPKLNDMLSATPLNIDVRYFVTHFD